MEPHFIVNGNPSLARLLKETPSPVRVDLQRGRVLPKHTSYFLNNRLVSLRVWRDVAFASQFPVTWERQTAAENFFDKVSKLRQLQKIFVESPYATCFLRLLAPKRPVSVALSEVSLHGLISTTSIVT